MKNTIFSLVAVFAAGLLAMPPNFTDDWDAAMKKAAKEGKNVFALFTGSDWCIWCKRLEGEVLSQKAFSSEIVKSYVPVYIDYPSDRSLVSAKTAAQNEKLSAKYPIRGYPTVLILDAKGEVLAQTGYQRGGPVKYLEHLKGLVKNAPLKDKHIKPFERKFESLVRKFGESMEAAVSKAKEADREKTAKDAMKKLAGPLAAEITALRKEFLAEKIPAELAGDKDALLKQIDQAVKALKQMSEGKTL